MTATPIPRTVAMTVFGDLDTSTLTELPAGRGDVQTTVVPAAGQAWLDRAWQRIREEVAKGRQAYVVCSRIDLDEGDDDRSRRRASARGRGDRPRSSPTGRCPGCGSRCCTAGWHPTTRTGVMRAFAAGDVDVLVSTTVIEVGVDVPNATVMVVLDADRFGVSQLHQLRGRIGRGGHAGLCLLVSAADPASTSMERLTAVAATRDGFELSRVDLEQRREGDVLGTEQTGRPLEPEAALGAARRGRHRARPRAPRPSTSPADPELAATRPWPRPPRRLEDSEQADYLEKT